MVCFYSGVDTERYAWTVNPIAKLCTRILQTLQQGDLPGDDLVQAFLLFHRCRNLSNLITVHDEKLAKAFSDHLSLHQPIYWSVVRATLIQEPTARWSVWRIMNELLRLGPDDLSWLLEDIVDLTDNAELNVAFDTALGIFGLDGQPQEQADLIADALEQSAADASLVAYVQQSLQPPEDQDHQPENVQQQRIENQQIVQRDILTQARADFHPRIGGIRQGEDLSALRYLQAHMRRSDTGNNSKWGQSNWQALISDFGNDIAAAARDGFKQGWKVWCPPLPHTRVGENGVELGVILGLTGLLIAAEDGENFTDFSADEAHNAVRYALREMNGFPVWFDYLVEFHQEIVRRSFVDQLQAEMVASVDAPEPGLTLQYIRSGSEAVRNICAPVIFEILFTGEPRRLKTLSDVLEILLMTNRVPRDQLITLARERTGEVADTGDLDRLISWLVFWLSIDGDGAWSFVESNFDTPVEVPDPIVFKLASVIGSGIWSHGAIEGTDFLKPRVLERMIPCMFSQVVPDDDPLFDGVYEIDERQNAQHCRDFLLQNLANQSGTEPQRVLNALVDAGIGTHHTQAWIKKLAEQQAAKATEYEPWSPDDIATFGNLHEKRPTSADELFAIVVDRIEAITFDVETGDFSVRELFSPDMSEAAIQSWLAGRLDRESRTQYSVVREEEVDGRKRPDIRLHNPAAGRVTIEIKPVEKGGRYTFKELVVALESQLVGQYLRDANSQHGILIIAMLLERRWDPRDGNGLLDFEGLLERLNGRACEIVASNPEVDRLLVVGINFARNDMGGD